MKLRWLLIAMLLASCSPSTHKTELVSLFPGARKESIIMDEQSPNTEQEWRFFLHGVIPVRLTLQMESPKPGKVHPTFNGEPLTEQTLAAGQKVIDIEISAERLRPGWNSLKLQAPPSIRCQALLAAPLHAALSAKTGQVVRPSIEGPNLLIPFGQAVVFPLPPQSASHLSFKVEPWLEDGVAALKEESWTLNVCTRQDDPETIDESRISELGAQGASLPPFAKAAMLELRLQPNGRHVPLPGQLGLRLVNPVLELEARRAAPPAPTPASAPSPSVSIEDNGVRLRDLKLVARPPALFDLAADPEQTQDLILQRPATALHLESVWLISKAETTDQQSKDEALRNLRTLEYLR